jgi:hypothetical protein
MSFGAVIAIVALYEHSWHFSGFLKTLFNIVATTVVASIPTALFSLYAFNQLTLNSIFANILSIPLMSFFVMPLAVMALFLMPFDLARPFVGGMGYGVQLLMKISELAAQLPGSCFIMPTPTSANMAVFIFSGLLLTLVQHRIHLGGIIGLIAGGIYYCVNPAPDILVSPRAKVVGVKVDDALCCFNHRGYFRAMTTAWAKSLGIEKRERFDSKSCRRYITKISDDTYAVDLGGKNLTITRDEDYSSPSADVIFLDKNADFARLMYFRPRRWLSNEQKRRPWS